MDFNYNRPIRVLSIIVLFFFCWTFAGGFDVAYAIKNSEQQSANSNQASGSNQQSKTLKHEEKFQKTIEDITQIVNDTSTDTDTKKNKLKTKRTEVEGLDVEIKKQLNDTERFLKEKGLPPEILERHRKFVKHYEDNLNELKRNIDEVEKSKTKSEADAAISRAKAHLEKIKAPSKHKKLDPNRLPHRTAEPVWIEPRTTPEQFKTEDRAQNQEHRQKPILVASAGPLKGLLNMSAEVQKSGSAVASDFSTSGLPGLVVAQATNVPTDADLAETPEVQFTEELREIAALLENNPVYLYEFVRNNFNYEPYYGSIKGSQSTLLL